MTDYEDQKDLGTQGKSDTAKGKFDQAAGKVQRKAGEVLGNREMQAKGAAREVGGHVQSAAGQAEQKIDEAGRRRERDRERPYEDEPGV